jgi:hypothetical protein
VLVCRKEGLAAITFKSIGKCSAIPIKLHLLDSMLKSPGRTIYSGRPVYPERNSSLL